MSGNRFPGAERGFLAIRHQDVPEHQPDHRRRLQAGRPIMKKKCLVLGGMIIAALMKDQLPLASRDEQTAAAAALLGAGTLAIILME